MNQFINEVRSPKFTTRNKGIYLLMILMLLLVNDNLVFEIIGNDTLVRLLLFLGYCLIYIKFIIIDGKKINYKNLIILLFMIILALINMFVNNDFTLGYLYITMLLIMAFITCEIISFEDFIEASIKVVFFITLYALVCYVLSPVIFQYKSFLPRFVNDAELPFIHLGLAVLVDIEGYNRMFGFFRESGVYQIFINLAIIMELFIRKKKVRIIYLVVLFIGLILTFSTPGYIATGMIFFSYLFSNKKKKSKKEKKAFITVSISLIILFIILYLTNTTFSNGFNNAWTKLFNKESSYMGRATSVFVELKIWTESPFFGYGIQQGFDLSKKAGAEALGFFMYNTSTITGLFVTLGWLFTFVLLLMLLNFCLRLNAKIIGILLISFSIVLMISSQLLMYNAYFYALLFISIKSTDYIKTGLVTPNDAE